MTHLVLKVLLNLNQPTCGTLNSADWLSWHCDH